MKLRNRILSLLVCGAMLATTLAGCGTKNKQETPEEEEIPLGRYIEQPWELPGNTSYMNAVHRRPDGRIGMLISNEEGVEAYYSVSDGTDWQEESPAWLAEINKIEPSPYTRDLCFNSKGLGAVVYYVHSMEEDTPGITKVCLIQPDGTLTDTPIGDLNNPHTKADGLMDEDGRFGVQSMSIGEDGQLYMTYYQRGMGRSSGRFDPVEGKRTASFPEGGSAFTMLGDGVAQFMDRWSVRRSEDSALEGDSLVFYDNAGVQQRVVPSGDLGAENWGTVFGALPDGTVYAANKTGIYRLEAEGETWEKILDGALSAISLPSLHPDSILPHGDGEFLIAYNGEENQLINHVYSQETPSRPAVELDIYTMSSDDTVSQAMGAFRKAHPEVMVTIRTGENRGEEGSLTADDLRAALNTELLAGKGPDIFLLEGLPLKSYIEKGVLIDLAPLLQPKLDAGELQSNVVTSLEQDGKLYAIPAQFQIPTLWGLKEAVAAADSLSTLADYAEGLQGEVLLGDATPDWVMFNLARSRMNAFLGADGQVDVDYLEAFYTDIKRILDAQPPQDEENLYMYNEWFWQYAEDSEGAFAIARSQSPLMFANLGTIESIMLPNGALYARLTPPEQQDSENTNLSVEQVAEMFRLVPGATAQERVFYPSCIVGINAASSQQELAAEFLLTMLEEDAQSVDRSQGFSVNRKVLNKLINDKHEMGMSYISTDENGVEQVDLTMSGPSTEVMKAIAAHMDSLNTPVLYSIENNYLMEMIINGSQAYIGGSLSAREAAEAVRQDTRIMLTE